VFMIARAMAGRTGEEDNLSVFSSRSHSCRQDHEREKDSVHAAEPNSIRANLNSFFGCGQPQCAGTIKLRTSTGDSATAGLKLELFM
jgi:hypothetical protein